jgi:hypothetical protein
MIISINPSSGQPMRSFELQADTDVQTALDAAAGAACLATGSGP